MRLGDGVLELPDVEGLLGEGDELFAGGDGEGAEVLVLSAILELLGPLPGRKIRAARGEADLDDVGQCEVLEELCALGLEDTDACGDGVGEETAVGAVLVRACGNLGCLKVLDGIIVRRTTDETKALLRADYRWPSGLDISLKIRRRWTQTDRRTAGTIERPFCAQEGAREAS